LLPDAKPQLGLRLDALGLALLSPGIAIFVYGMSTAGNAGGFGGGRAIAGIVGGAVLVALFALHARRRGSQALLDLSLLVQRGFATAAATTLLLGIALFGALILLPLDFQLVRRTTPFETGLLLVPQGLGAAVAMPFAGRLTDTVGARVVIPVGVVLALLGTAVYTQVGADTSYAVLAVALFVIGLGLGATIMPAMAVAYQSVSREAVARATGALNMIQRIAASVGTALLAVVLQRALRAQVPDLNGGLRTVGTVAQQRHEQIAPVLADAFGTAFWVALVLIALALIPALLLPWRGEHVAEG
jgi:MFS family permease